MGHDKTAIRQNVLDGDNLPNAILNAIIAGYDAPTIISDTIEVLQTGETTSYMFEATPDAIEQFAEAFVDKVKLVAAELRDFEYIDKPVIRRKSGETVTSAPSDTQTEGRGLSVEAEPDLGEGIDVESAGEGDVDMDLVEGPEPDPVEQTIRKVGVQELKIDAILKAQKPLDGGGFEGKIAIKFPVDLKTTGRQHPAGVLSSQGISVDELGDAVTNYTLDFIGRNAEKYFGGMDAEIASRTLEFTDFKFSESNDSALVSTFMVGTEQSDSMPDIGLARAARQGV